MIYLQTSTPYTLQPTYSFTLALTSLSLPSTYTRPFLPSNTPQSAHSSPISPSPKTCFHPPRLRSPNINQNTSGSAYSAYSFTYRHLPTPSFPPTVHDQALKATIDMVKYYKTGHAAICAFDHPTVKACGPGPGPITGGMGGGSSGYLELLAKAKSVVRFGLIMGSDRSADRHDSHNTPSISQGEALSVQFVLGRVLAPRGRVE